MPHRSVLCALVALCILVTASTAAAFTGQPRVINGDRVTIDQAPYTALVFTTSIGGCTGAVLSSTQILTAGHCVTDAASNAVSPSAVRVWAGLSSYPIPLELSSGRAVTGVRVHPGYSQQVNGVDDVALLTLASPLDLSGPAPTAIDLVDPGTVLGAGSTVTSYGYGQQRYDAPPDGTLGRATMQITADDDCTIKASVICATANPAMICHGDSGGPLVVGTPARLLGISSYVDSPECRLDDDGLFVSVAVPEIRAFLNGATIPYAPRFLDNSTINGGVYGPGAAASCDPGPVSNSPTFRYRFWTSDGQALADGPSNTYAFAESDIGKPSAARSTPPTPAVQRHDA